MLDHPLFPSLSEDDEAPEVCFIGLAREDRGVWVTVPEIFTAEELTDLSQIAQRFGGGHYELIARHGGASGRQLISKRVRYRIAGEPLPLSGPAPVAAPSVAHAPHPHPSAPMGFDGNVILAIMQMQAQQMQSFLGFITTIMTTVMAKGDQASAQIIKAMGDLSAADKANMGSFFQAMAQMKTGGTGELANFMQGLKFAGEIGAAQNAVPEAESEDGIGETLQQVIQGAALVGQLMNSPGTPPATPPGVAPHTPATNAPPDPKPAAA